MVEISGIFVGLIFVAAVAGLIAVNDIGSVESSQGANSETNESIQNSQDKVVLALNNFDTKLVAFFSDIKENLGFL